jgi:hypothetical protein
MITSDGKILIAKYLAGIVDSYAGAIAVGVGTTAETDADKLLDYEFARVPILVRNVVGPTSDGIFQVSYKGTLPSQLEGVICEAGIISQIFNQYSGAYGDRLIAKFSSSELWTTTSSSNMTAVQQTMAGVANDTAAIRIGGEGIYITSQSASSPSIEIQSTVIQGDFSGYSSADQFALGYSGTYIPAGTSIQIKLYSSASDYWFYTFTSTQNLYNLWGYKMKKFTKSEFSPSGSPSWDSITKIGVAVATTSASTKIMLDGLSMFDTDYINPDYSMVSRTVLSTPVVKSAGKSMDVEYFLEYRL